MKNTLIILFLFISSLVGATTYYVDPAGNNANSGAAGSPWKTLAYATSKATASGDIIHVNAGSYTETSQSILAVGVSIEGAGVSSIIHSSMGSALIVCSSSTPNTNGNQHITGLLLDGNNLAGDRAIMVEGRSNVEIANCTFQNFKTMGVVFGGAGAPWNTTAPPDSHLSRDNKFHHNIMNNCSIYDAAGDNGWGNICVGYQYNMQIYNNTITQNQRDGASNGYCIKFYNYGWNQAWKIYNNTLINKPSTGPQPNMSWGFAIETWNSMGGMEIHDNIIQGGIDLVRVYKGTFAKGVDIYNNTLGYNAIVPALDTEGEVGIRLEAAIQEVHIHHNRFKYHMAPVYADLFGTTDRYENGVYIYYNICENIGSNLGQGFGFRFTGDNASAPFTNLKIQNNVFVSNPNVKSTYGITIPGVATSGVNISNNIIVGFSGGPVYKSSSGTYSDITIANNIFYNNGNSNTPAGTYSGSQYNISNNIVTNPMFVSATDYRLQTSSPAISKGLSTSMCTLDFGGAAIKNPPCIGPYESGSVTVPVQGAAPVYQNSIVENATPTLLTLNYDLALNNLFVPVATSYSVLVNAVAVTVSKVAISASKVQLTLSAAIKYGDIVKLTYTKPATNPVQTAAGGIAASISSLTATNNLAAPTKDATPVTLSMTISPTHVHRTINLLLNYANALPAQISGLTPEVVKITDTSGKLFVEKLLVSGAHYC